MQFFCNLKNVYHNKEKNQKKTVFFDWEMFGWICEGLRKKSIRLYFYAAQIARFIKKIVKRAG